MKRLLLYVDSSRHYRYHHTSVSSDTAPVYNSQATVESEYIRQETRNLFRRNANIADPKEIEAHIQEGESRLELALHCNNPYPRLSNLPPSAIVNRSMKRAQRAFDDSVPAYLRSYKAEKGKGSSGVASVQQRARVLNLYKRLMRLSKTCTSASDDAHQVTVESEYIRQETRSLFRRNANIADPKEIEAHIHEGESRLELALHCNNPYPRLSNLPQSAIVNRSMKRGQRAFDDCVPAYLRSYKAENGNCSSGGRSSNS
ncbi:hypothetical protein Aperf_G00000123580 [Anoplocephala perfoliata]